MNEILCKFVIRFVVNYKILFVVGNAHKKRKKKTFIRHRWTEEELAEVKKLFSYCFKEERTPTQSEVVAAQKKSKANGGGLWKLSVVVVKSKVSWLRLHPSSK